MILTCFAVFSLALLKSKGGGFSEEKMFSASNGPRGHRRHAKAHRQDLRRSRDMNFTRKQKLYTVKGWYCNSICLLRLLDFNLSVLSICQFFHGKRDIAVFTQLLTPKPPLSHDFPCQNSELKFGLVCGMWPRQCRSMKPETFGCHVKFLLALQSLSFFTLYLSCVEWRSGNLGRCTIHWAKRLRCPRITYLQTSALGCSHTWRSQPPTTLRLPPPERPESKVKKSICFSLQKRHFSHS